MSCLTESELGGAFEIILFIGVGTDMDNIIFLVCLCSNSYLQFLQISINQSINRFKECQMCVN